jgi:hypothetical protein
MPPNFVLLDSTQLDIARLVVAMVQARDAVGRRSWSHPQEPTSNEWWASNVNFAIRVGTVVPTSVRIVEVPAIEIHPEWRGHMYFVVGDEIIIVDRNHRIIAVIAV